MDQHTYSHIASLVVVKLDWVQFDYIHWAWLMGSTEGIRTLIERITLPVFYPLDQIGHSEKNTNLLNIIQLKRNKLGLSWAKLSSDWVSCLLAGIKLKSWLFRLERFQQSLNEIAMKFSYHWSSEEKNTRVGVLVGFGGWISLYVTSIVKYVQFIYSKLGA